MLKCLLLTIIIACFAGCSRSSRSTVGQQALPPATSSSERSLSFIEYAQGPKIIFAQTEHDFGRMPSGSRQTISFDFINAGTEDLKLERIQSCCGVSARLPEDRTVAPGQVAEISVTYLAGLSSGVQKKKIILTTNDPQNKETDLWVLATIPRGEFSTTIDSSKSGETPTNLSSGHDTPSTPVRRSVDFLRHSISR